MSFNYTANPQAQQSPSPQPGPNTIPVVAMPADGDPDNAATFQQGYKVTADGLAYLQKTAKFRPPFTPNGLTGFTSVTHVGGGSGTITPVALTTSTGAQPTSTPYNLLFKIIVGGAVGTATFQASTDGGNTFGSTQTSAATYTEPTSGVVVAFSGTFQASDTYAFQGTDTPIASFPDTSGNNHGAVIDHLGYLGGKFTEVREDWFGVANTSFTVTTNPVSTALSRWQLTISSTGNSAINAATNANYAGPYWQLGTSLVSASGPTLQSLGYTIPNPSSNTGLMLVVEFDLGIQTIGSQSTVFAGVTNGTAQLTGFSQFGTTMQFEVSGGAPANVPYTLTGATYPNMRCRMEIGGSASTQPGTRAFINEQLVYTSAVIPSGGTLGFYFQVQGGATTSSGAAYLGAVRAAWNRYANPAPL